MSSRLGNNKMDRHREKLIQDRLQLLLNRMLQEEDNKYCVDCDSKGKLAAKTTSQFRVTHIRTVSVLCPFDTQIKVLRETFLASFT